MGILNSGIILKTFTHETLMHFHVNKNLFCVIFILKSNFFVNFVKLKIDACTVQVI